jgi:uncharacterized alkaline shock family protein YloU
MEKKDTQPESEATVPFVSDGEGSLGEIRINHSVVANIVRIATLNIPGVHEVSGGRFEGIADMFSKKESERGVRVREDEGGVYEIEIRVILDFGVELARTGGQIQQTVREEVSKMTSKDVGRVDIIIDGIHVPEAPKEDASTQWEA